MSKPKNSVPQPEGPKQNIADNAASVLGHCDLAKADLALLQKALIGSSIELAKHALTRVMQHVQRINALFEKLPESGDLFGRMVQDDDARDGDKD